MELQPQAVKQFARLYEKECGICLKDEEAEMKLLCLLDLLSAVRKGALHPSAETSIRHEGRTS